MTTQIYRSGSPHSTFTNVLSELKSRKSSAESNSKVNRRKQLNYYYANPVRRYLFVSIIFRLPIRVFAQSVVPPPPPLPPPPELIDPSETRPFMDPYGRAKTVRIGKWRWPPPKDDNSQDTSFIQFKMKQKRKHSHVSRTTYLNTRYLMRVGTPCRYLLTYVA